MNKIYRKLWSRARAQVVVASELARGDAGPTVGFTPARRLRVVAKVLTTYCALWLRQGGTVKHAALGGGVLALIAASAPASAQVYVNDGTDGNCAVITDTFASTAYQASVNAAKCNTAPATQTDHSQFFGPTGVSTNNNGASSSLSLGGSLYVNAGRIGVTDVAGGTYSIRMGSASTLAATAGTNAIAIGSQQTSTSNGSSTTATTASGANSVAIGTAAQASSGGAIALGQIAKSQGNQDVAIGYNSQTNGDSAPGAGAATALGQNSLAGVSGATAIGANSVANGQHSTAVNGNASGAYASAIGGATASGYFSAAVGQGAQATTSYASSIGPNSKATASGANALGSSAQATASGANAVGSSASATGNFSSAFGDSAIAGGSSNNANTTAVGNGAWAGNGGANQTGATALGSVAHANGQNATAIGYSSVASATGATALGATGSGGQVGATASGASSLALGAADVTAEGGATTPVAVNGAAASGVRAIAIGSGSSTPGASSIAMGDGARAGTSANANAIAIGTTASATGAKSIAIGFGNNVSGANSGAFGDPTTISGSGSYSVGNNNTIPTNNTFVVGSGVDTTGSGDGNVVLGNASTIAAPSGTAYATGTAAPASQVSVGSASAARRITNVSAGSAATDAVNVSQLNQIATNTANTTGGSYTAAGVYTAPTISVGGTTRANLAAAVNAEDGIVQNQGNTTAAALGGGSTYTPSTGAVSAPSYTVANIGTTGAVGTPTTVTNVGAAVTNLSTDVTNIANNLNNGTVGPVQRTGTTNQLALIAPGGSGSAPGTAQNLTNVAPGTLSASSTDAVNGSQLYALGSSTASTLGGNATYNPTTGQVTTSNIGGTGQNNVNDAISTVAATAGKGWNVTTANTGTGTVSGTSVANVAPGATQTVTAGDNIAITQNGTDYTIATNPNLVSTSITTGNAKLDTNGLAITGGPSVLASGINAGGQRITNVAAGTQQTDAVNLSQLQQATTRYYSVNSSNAARAAGTGTNYDNLGATGGLSVAAGANASAGQIGATAVGNAANAAGVSSVALGQDAAAIGTGDITIGRGSGTGGLSSNYGNIAMGLFTGTDVSGRDNVAIGDNAGRTVTGSNNVALGIGGSNVSGDQNVAIGAAGANVTGSYNVGLGYRAGAGVTGSNNVALGQDAGRNINASDAVSLGHNASANNSKDVALGSGSVTAVAVGTASTTIQGTTYNFAGTSPGSTVSVGALGSERTITNVAAGRISDTSTDAVNGSQLYAANQAIDVVGDRVTTLGGNVATVLGGNAAYDTATGGLTMSDVGGTGQNNVNDAISTVAATAGKGWNATTAAAGTGTVSGTSVANVAPGATQTVTAGDNIAITQNGTDYTIATNPDLVSTSITTGNAKLDTNGLAITGGPSVLASGIDAGSQKITNVADGTIATGSTDAVNGGQLASVTSGVTSQGLNFTGNDASAGTVHRDLGQTLAISGAASTAGTYSGGNLKTVTDPTNGAIGLQMADAPKFGNVTVNDAGSGKITGVTAATLSASSTEAVNGSQLFATNSYINNTLGGGADVATGAAPTYTIGGNTYNNVGDAFTAVNNGSVGVVQRTTSADVATMTAAGGTAASPGNPQRLANLADGVNANDAVNLSQLQAAQAAATTHYYSVNDGGTSGGNYLNNGATGINSVAAGIGASTNARSGIAIGASSVTESSANASQASIAIGTGNALTNSANAVGVGNANTVSNSTIVGLLGGSNTLAQSQETSVIGVRNTLTGVSGSGVVGKDNRLTTVGSSSVIGADNTLTNVTSVAVTGGNNTAINGAAASSVVGASNTLDQATASNLTGIGNTARNTSEAGLTGVNNTISGGSQNAIIGSNNQLVNATKSLVNGFGNTLGTGLQTVQVIASGATVTDNVARGIVMGSGGQLGGNDTIAVGTSAVAGRDNAIAIGNGAQATGLNAISVGTGNVVSGDNSGAFGDPTTITGSGSYSLGNDNTISGNRAFVVGSNVNNAVDDSVVLGAGSTVAAASGTAGATIAGTSYSFAGAAPLSTVSVGAAGQERTITNVAAGRLSGTSTDAVNGSQLFATNQAVDAAAATAGKGWNVTTANTGTGTVSGTSVANVAPGATQTVTAGDNIAITQNGTDYTIATTPDLVSTSITTGNAKLDTNGLAITGGPSVLASGIDAGSQKITNVADGTVAAGSTDAVNGGQLAAVTSGVTSQGLNFTGNDASAGTVHRDLGQTLAISGGASTAGAYSGANLKTVTDPTNGAISLQMADAPKFGNVTVNDAGSGKITGVTAATLSASSTEAVNGSQLFATNSYINNALGGGADVAAGTAPTYTVGGNTYNTVGDAFTAVNNGSVGVVQRTTSADVATMTAAGGTAANPGNAQRLTNLADGVNANDAVNLSQLTNATGGVTSAGLNFAGDSGAATHRDLGQTLNVKGGATGTLTDNNIGVVSDGTDTLTVKLAENVDLGANGSLTTGSTTINNSGLTIAGGPSVTSGGINAGGSAITNVGAGVNGTDAANMNQLNAVSDTASKGWNLQANGDSATQVKPGDTVQLKDGQNIRITRSGTDVTVATADDLVSNSITTGNSRLDGSGVTLSGGPGGAVILSNSGLDNGGNRLVNVAAGIAATDAVNLSQLNSAIAGATTHYYSVADGGNQGGNYAGDGATASNALAAGVGTTASAAGATAVGSGSSASASGATAIGRDASASAQGSVALGDGASDGGRGAESYTGKYSWASNSSVGTVSVGNASTGATRTISNVADGSQATDAVNLRQLDGAVQAANTYTDGKVQQINQQVAQNNADIKNVQEGRDGFFQVNNTAAGAKPSVTGTNAAAGGSGAVASGANSLAVGTQAQATADNAVALGSGSVADRANTVSVGQAGSERKITNVAAGTASTDAVNVSQLQASQQGSVHYASNADGSVNYGQVALGNGQAPTTVSNVAAGVNGTDAVNVNQLNQGFGNAMRYTDAVAGQVQRDANGGIAAAVATANLPQSYIPGRGMTSVGLGSYQGQSAIAVGVSAITDNGRWVIKFSGTADTRGQTGVGAGVGYQW
ncbi:MULTISPECIES: ESPR-type extended signal peptide-containing protein [Pseudoxanthomonas]|uniref:Autotransporter adhesin n=1 Tax=Pseudoxanthomonas winnipegensis TaxID=2480810 RepID=A0AAW8G9U4_9GAMM|nr:MULTISPECIES: ESPR-type extended signal peptide-containing protein [Pseudoxanthomonas]MDQ1119155.1 autotransporter adhesin [Pseudoxanthomonas winnipegensis]MDQ1132344.1 autotransporter adhesin [Pseudoxanthomonas winnipegensis]MDR6137643.1 autotransporter adhesin [Pseudoxanthomonas sp. SORGH_AS_0997]